MQRTRVPALVREDPTCRRAAKPVRHNYRAREPQLLSPTQLTHQPQGSLGPSCAHQQANTSSETPCTPQPATPVSSPTHQWAKSSFGTSRNLQPAMSGTDPNRQQADNRPGSPSPTATHPRTPFCPPVGQQ
ncbi:hypothetical protein J1605_006767 [Eschrichtius robustus]|uniref:Uncharacterized protein n=1 Tax=Eschrichtius robustus TaxID=9764 RepID=A0AB34GZ82_ESCRO|nr:hypothetical protein J1605_006767 [Eschrichtius robustus]